MATLAIARRRNVVQSPETIEPDVRTRHNDERNLLARITIDLRNRWQGYQERGLIAAEDQDFLDYIPVPPRRIITMKARIVGQSRGTPLVFPFDDED